MAEKHYYMYVLLCADGTLYTGYTVNLVARVETHNAGKGAKYTRQTKRRPVQLLFAAIFQTKSAAMRAEARFKQLSRQQKAQYLSRYGVQIKKAATPIIIEIEEGMDGTTEF